MPGGFYIPRIMLSLYKTLVRPHVESGFDWVIQDF